MAGDLTRESTLSSVNTESTDDDDLLLWQGNDPGLDLAAVVGVFKEEEIADVGEAFGNEGEDTTRSPENDDTIGHEDVMVSTSDTFLKRHFGRNTRARRFMSRVFSTGSRFLFMFDTISDGLLIYELLNSADSTNQNFEIAMMMCGCMLLPYIVLYLFLFRTYQIKILDVYGHGSMCSFITLVFAYLIFGVPALIVTDMFIVTRFLLSDLKKTQYLRFYERSRHLCESLFESLPQIALQFYIFLNPDSENGGIQISLWLLTLSLLGSLMSIGKNMLAIYYGAKGNNVPFWFYARTLFRAGVGIVPNLTAIRRGVVLKVSYKDFRLRQEQLREVIAAIEVSPSLQHVSLEGNYVDRAVTFDLCNALLRNTVLQTVQLHAGIRLPVQRLKGVHKDGRTFNCLDFSKLRRRRFRPGLHKRQRERNTGNLRSSECTVIGTLLTRNPSIYHVRLKDTQLDVPLWRGDDSHPHRPDYRPATTISIDGLCNQDLIVISALLINNRVTKHLRLGFGGNRLDVSGASTFVQMLHHNTTLETAQFFCTEVHPLAHIMLMAAEKDGDLDRLISVARTTIPEESGKKKTKKRSKRDSRIRQKFETVEEFGVAHHVAMETPFHVTGAFQHTLWACANRQLPYWKSNTGLRWLVRNTHRFASNAVSLAAMCGEVCECDDMTAFDSTWPSKLGPHGVPLPHSRHVSALQWCVYALESCDAVINAWPRRAGTTARLPHDLRQQMWHVYKLLFRVYAHIFDRHIDDLAAFGAQVELSLHLTFRDLMRMIYHFRLVRPTQLEVLHERLVYLRDNFDRADKWLGWREDNRKHFDYAALPLHMPEEDLLL